MIKYMKTPEARKLIGKWVEWDVDSILSRTRKGIVEDVRSKNILISGDWYWLPHLENLRETSVPAKKD